MAPYEYTGPVKCDTDFDTSNVKGKTAVVTGGANGIGEGYVRRLVGAGAFVVFGDVDEECGKQVEADLKGKAQYVKCDVTKWRDQLAMFKQAIANSPNKRVDIAVANAGVAGYDDIMDFKLDQEDPVEPKLNILNINGIGALYTVQLALHYFHRQFSLDKEASQDQVLVLQGSLAGYLDLKGAVQYGFSKYGLRGVMKNLRQTEHEHGIRVAFIGPWFVKTKILSKQATEGLTAGGFEFATVEDAATALLKIVSDTSITGHSFAIVPRSNADSGYVDIDVDDYTEGGLGLMKQLNDMATGAIHRVKK